MIRLLAGIMLLNLLAVTGCKNKAGTTAQEYIDVAGYLKGQLRYLDTVPHGYLKVTEIDSVHNDSVYLTKEQVQKIASDFLEPELDKKNFAEKFTETTFADATLQTITVTYHSTDPGNTIERVDVYINPQTGAFNQVYLIKTLSGTDGVTKKQLLWKHNSGFKIISQFSFNSKPESTRTENIIWQ